MPKRSPNRFSLWSAQDIRVRKPRSDLSDCRDNALLLEREHGLTYFIALSFNSFFGPPRSMSEILSGDLCTCLRKAANKIFFTYLKVASNVTEWERSSFSTQNGLEKCLDAGTIALPNWAFCT
jgi:hypothetical protein